MRQRKVGSADSKKARTAVADTPTNVVDSVAATAPTPANPGISETSLEFLIKWLNTNVLRSPIHSFPKDIVNSNGRPIFDMVEVRRMMCRATGGSEPVVADSVVAGAVAASTVVVVVVVGVWVWCALVCVWKL